MSFNLKCHRCWPQTRSQALFGLAPLELRKDLWCKHWPRLNFPWHTCKNHSIKVFPAIRSHGHVTPGGPWKGFSMNSTRVGMVSHHNLWPCVPQWACQNVFKHSWLARGSDGKPYPHSCCSWKVTFINYFSKGAFPKFLAFLTPYPSLLTFSTLWKLSKSLLTPDLPTSSCQRSFWLPPNAPCYCYDKGLFERSICVDLIEIKGVFSKLSGKYIVVPNFCFLS